MNEGMKNTKSNNRTQLTIENLEAIPITMERYSNCTICGMETFLHLKYSKDYLRLNRTICGM